MADPTIEQLTERRTHGILGRVVSSQEFWVTAAVILLAGYLVMETNVFDTARNLRNSAINMSFIGILALGQMCVIITAGIDLSVGSVMAVGAVGTGLMMNAGFGFPVSLAVGLLAAMAVGMVNGVLISFMKLPPFVVTLGAMSICRTIAMAATNNQLIYNFGPDEDSLLWLGTGRVFGDTIPVPFVILVALTLLLTYMLLMTQWGRHLYAIGGNEDAARVTGVPVAGVKISAYAFCSLMAGLSGIMLMGWSGSLNNSIGLQYELRAIAASVIGGANLMGGFGSAFGAFIGATLLEILRNSLVLLKIDTNFHLGFIGLFIILAVMLERVRDSRFSLSGLIAQWMGRKR